MTRDMDLVREILLALEQVPPEELPPYPFVLGGYRQADVDGHLRVLDEAGLIEARIASANDGSFVAFPIRMTWNGHDFLDAIRNDTVWGKVKERVRSFGTAVSFEVVKALAVSVVQRELGVD